MADAKLNIVANALRQNDTQDPLGVTWATWQRDPRAGEVDSTDTQTPKRTLADRYNTRKSIDHQQIGASWEQRFGDDKLRATAYGGNRSVVQYQSFSKGFQAPATHSGGVVDFDRDFYGIDVNWLHVAALAGGRLSTTIGIEYGRSSDARTGYEKLHRHAVRRERRVAPRRRRQSHQHRSVCASGMAIRPVDAERGPASQPRQILGRRSLPQQRQRQRHSVVQPHHAGGWA
jgi:hypothetical protein